MISDLLFPPPSVVTFSRAALAAACHAHGPELNVAALNLDGARVLWAIAGVESSFGLNCQPRHEMSYCTGSLSHAPQVVALTEKYGHAAHASFGPWQMMLCNAASVTTAGNWACPPENFASLEFCVEKAVAFINARILKAEGARTLEQIAWAYNAGTFRQEFEPVQYIQQAVHNYGAVPLP